MTPLKDLIAKAKAAQANCAVGVKCIECGFDFISYRHSYDCSVPEDVFKSAANPQTILALCEALERAREALEWIGDSHASPTKYYYNVKARQALAEIEKLLGGGE